MRSETPANAIRNAHAVIPPAKHDNPPGKKPASAGAIRPEWDGQCLCVPEVASLAVMQRIPPRARIKNGMHRDALRATVGAKRQSLMGRFHRTKSGTHRRAPCHTRHRGCSITPSGERGGVRPSPDLCNKTANGPKFGAASQQLAFAPRNPDENSPSGPGPVTEIRVSDCERRTRSFETSTGCPL